MAWEVDKLPTGPGLIKRHGVLDVNWDAPNAPADGADGAAGADGVGVPPGGAANQILKKASAADYDTAWGDTPDGLPSQTGNAGKYLTTDGSNASWGTVSTSAGVGFIATFGYPGIITTATNTSMRWYIHAASTIIGVQASVMTAPTASSVIVDVNKNGTTIFTTQANRPTIATSGFYSGNVTTADITALAAGDYLTVDVDQVGTNAANLLVSVIYLIN